MKDNLTKTVCLHMYMTASDTYRVCFAIVYSSLIVMRG